MTTENDRPGIASTDGNAAFALQLDSMRVDELGRVLVPHTGNMPADMGAEGQGRLAAMSDSLCPLPDSFCPPQVSGSSCERPQPPPSNDLCTCVAQCGCGPGMSNCA